ncbi:MAG: histidine phosphatase family protein [Lachnospirales bacterium]
MRILLIRHGKTKGNLEKKFIGRTDQSLEKEGILEIKNIAYDTKRVKKVYVSPMKRCIETADIIFPNLEKEKVNNLREMDFGIFENKSHNELLENEYYVNWLNSNGLSEVPEGESLEEFRVRCVNAFLDIINNCSFDTVAFVIHGGSITAIMSSLLGEKYLKIVGNGRGYICEYENGNLKVIDEI